MDCESPFLKPPFDSSPKYEADVRPQGLYLSTRRHVDYEGPFPKPPFDLSPKYEAYIESLTNEGLNFCFAMAGFDKEDVKVTVNKNTLIIKGKGKGMHSNPEEIEREYHAQVVLPDGVLKLDQVRRCVPCRG